MWSIWYWNDGLICIKVNKLVCDSLTGHHESILPGRLRDAILINYVYFLNITFYMILKIFSNECVLLTLFTRVSNILMNGLYMHLSIDMSWCCIISVCWVKVFLGDPWKEHREQGCFMLSCSLSTCNSNSWLNESFASHNGH